MRGHTCTGAHAQAHTQVGTRARARMHRHTHRGAHVHGRACTGTHTGGHTCTGAHAQAHTQGSLFQPFLDTSGACFRSPPGPYPTILFSWIKLPRIPHLGHTQSPFKDLLGHHLLQEALPWQPCLSLHRPTSRALLKKSVSQAFPKTPPCSLGPLWEPKRAFLEIIQTVDTPSRKSGESRHKKN